MATWSGKRKSIYAIVVIAVLVIAVWALIFYVLYKPPTCFDGMKNGDEQGVDCGGSCVKLCQTGFLAPYISWTRFKEVAPGFYNIAAYVVNPNPRATAKGVAYHIQVLDNQGVPIKDINDATDIPPGRNFLVFKGGVKIGPKPPARAYLEFTSTPEWTLKNDPLSMLTVADKRYTESDSDSSLMATIENGGAMPLDNVEVYAILKDVNGNALDFSMTSLDEIPAGGKAIAPFTWPVSHDKAVISIEILTVAE